MNSWLTIILVLIEIAIVWILLPLRYSIYLSEKGRACWLASFYADCLGWDLLLFNFQVVILHIFIILILLKKQIIKLW